MHYPIRHVQKTHDLDDRLELSEQLRARVERALNSIRGKKRKKVQIAHGSRFGIKPTQHDRVQR